MHWTRISFVPLFRKWQPKKYYNSIDKSETICKANQVIPFCKWVNNCGTLQVLKSWWLKHWTEIGDHYLPAIKSCHTLHFVDHRHIWHRYVYLKMNFHLIFIESDQNSSDQSFIRCQKLNWGSHNKIDLSSSEETEFHKPHFSNLRFSAVKKQSDSSENDICDRRRFKRKSILATACMHACMHLIPSAMQPQMIPLNTYDISTTSM